MPDVGLDAAHSLLGPRQAFLITARDPRDGRVNICTAGWVSGANWKPFKVSVALSKGGLTNELIRSSGEFVINVPDMDLLDEVVFCGRTSGRKLDKSRRAGLDLLPSKHVAAPYVARALARVECVVEQALEMDDHWVFVGRAVHAAARDGVFDGGYAVSRVRPVYQIVGERFCSLDGVEVRREIPVGEGWK
ncbi:MAG: flavin reductase family protein [Firmicutes bacterium]|nr:flavin reductase family protein [Bacillota bacterium]